MADPLCFSDQNNYKSLGGRTLTVAKRFPPTIDAAALAIVHREIQKFRGARPLKPIIYSGKRNKTTFESAKVDALVSAGNLALIHAQQTFDPSRGVKWTTWATTCVQQGIRRAAKPRKKDAMGASYELQALESPVGGPDERLTLEETLADPEQEPEILSESVWSRLQQLTPEREFDVLLSRFAGFTRAEIGNRLKVTAERVRQIGNVAVARVQEIIRTDEEMCRVLIARLFYSQQARDGQAVLYARPDRQPGWWAYRDGLRFEEAKAASSYDPVNWHEALTEGAGQAAIALGVSLSGLVDHKDAA